MNTKIKSGITIISVAIFFMLTGGCKKYLEEKSDKKLLIPATLQDLQALLDNYNVMNSEYCGGGLASADDYYLTDNDYNAFNYDYDKRMYIWGDNIFAPGQDGNDWDGCYRAIYTANSVIEGINKINRTSSNQATWDNVKGQALFFRGSRYLYAAYVWTLTYDAASALDDLGLPIRLGTDFNAPSVRSNLQETYLQIIDDIRASIPLLPDRSIVASRPSKAAAYGLLARAFLSMDDPQNAGLYADSCLRLHNQLMDYNSLSPSASRPVTELNEETIFYCVIATSYPLTYASVSIDSSLYNSYEANDLRKSIFFRSKSDGSYAFKASYTGSSALFCGIAADEIYLVRAECFARQGNIAKALDDLNSLLVKRWLAGTFIPVSGTNASDVLEIILQERRKELVMRGLRWSDLKRLNKRGANITLTRFVNGQKYTLPPNDLRYALPIPEDIVVLSSIQQNLR